MKREKSDQTLILIKIFFSGCCIGGDFTHMREITYAMT